MHVLHDPKFKNTAETPIRCVPTGDCGGTCKGWFLWLNLHYLPPVLRAKMLDALMDITNNTKFDKTTRFRRLINS